MVSSHYLNILLKITILYLLKDLIMDDSLVLLQKYRSSSVAFAKSLRERIGSKTKVYGDLTPSLHMLHRITGRIEAYDAMINVLTNEEPHKRNYIDRN